MFNKFKKTKTILNISFKNNDELKEILKILGYEIDPHEKKIVSKDGTFIKNSSKRMLDYRKLSSILPGSTVMIEKNDLTAVSRYYNEILDV